MVIAPAREADVAKASQCLADAFETDPLMAFFFPGPAEQRRILVMEMFTLLLSVRIALGMPALVLRHGGQIAGAAMGHDTRSVEWPASQGERWGRFEEKQSGMADRFKTFELVSSRFRPQASHYYLGALGVHPSMQG